MLLTGPLSVLEGSIHLQAVETQHPMSAHLHSFGCHVSSIALASTGDAAYALAHVFGNEWSGQIAVTRAGGEALTLQQQHGVTCAAWLAGDQAAVFGNEEGDLVCVRPAESGGKEALEEMAAAHDFDAPVASEWIGVDVSAPPPLIPPFHSFAAIAVLRTDRDGGGDGKSVVACSWDGMCRCMQRRNSIASILFQLCVNHSVHHVPCDVTPIHLFIRAGFTTCLLISAR